MDKDILNISIIIACVLPADQDMPMIECCSLLFCAFQRMHTQEIYPTALC